MCVSPKAKRFGVGFRYRSTQPTIARHPAKSLRMWAIAFRRHTHRQDACATGVHQISGSSVQGFGTLGYFLALGEYRNF